MKNLRFLTINVPGAASTNVVGINNQGVISGSYTDSTGVHGFILAGTQFTRFSYPGSSYTSAESINDRGMVVGVYFRPDGTPAGFLRTPAGHFTSITDPHAGTGPDRGTYVNSINDHGVIAGDYFTSSYIEHGFLYRSGRFTTVDVPHGFYGAPGYGNGIFGLNGAGVLVGPYTPNRTVVDGYVDSVGHFYTITGPGAGPSTDTFAGGISDSGVIVGRALGPNLIYHGWLLSGWRFTVLNDPQATTTPVKNEIGGTAATDINQSGVVVGRYWDSHHVEHGFMVYTHVIRGASLLLGSPRAGSRGAGARTAGRSAAIVLPDLARLTN